VVIALAGEDSTQRLLILSQVVLSLQLSFAVIPLIHFTSNRRNMGPFATPWWGQALAWGAAAIIVVLNGKLVLNQIGEWVDASSTSAVHLGPIPLYWMAAAGLYSVALAAFLLLLWVTIKPFVRPSPPWLPQPSVKLNWARLLRPRRLSRIGVALEHNTNDAEILNRALGLAQSQSEPCELTLLHVVDTAMTRVLGPETADRESDADERYLADVVDALRERGYRARAVLLHGPNPAEELISHLRHDPVDLLVVGSHGHGMVRDLLLGQTVDRVRHRLEVPMLIARPDRESPVADALSPLPRHESVASTDEHQVPAGA
jgi:manganese transport protein